MKRWYVHFRDQVYANGPFTAKNKQAAKQWVRNWLGLSKLPKGTEIWQA